MTYRSVTLEVVRNPSPPPPPRFERRQISAMHGLALSSPPLVLAGLLGVGVPAPFAAGGTLLSQAALTRYLGVEEAAVDAYDAVMSLRCHLRISRRRACAESDLHQRIELVGQGLRLQALASSVGLPTGLAAGALHIVGWGTRIWTGDFVHVVLSVAVAVAAGLAVQRIGRRKVAHALRRDVLLV
jgi:hypothetical protein